VAAGILPAVEPSVPPGGRNDDNAKSPGNSTPRPGGKLPPSTAGGTPAATERPIFDFSDVNHEQDFDENPVAQTAFTVMLFP